MADRENLDVRIVQGDMADLSIFDDASFDLIFHPVANVFVPDLTPVWQECARVLKPGGRLLAGYMNPAFFWFDHEECEKTGEWVVKYPLPFSEVTSLPPPSDSPNWWRRTKFWNLVTAWNLRLVANSKPAW